MTIIQRFLESVLCRLFLFQRLTTVRIMDELCYNCKATGHLSIRCPEPPKYSRCFDCRRVCENPEGHYILCSNKQFVSRYIEQMNTVRSATLVADMKFSTRYPLYLMDGPQEIDISQEFAPMQIQANFGLLLGKAKNLKYYQWIPGTNHRCVINVMDSENIVRFSACLLVQL